MLTETDQELIQRQCKLQNAITIAEIAAFTRAYTVAKIASESCEAVLSHPDTIISLVSVLGVLTVPETHGNFRSFPAVFDSGDKGVAWQVVYNAMVNWALAVANKSLSPLEIYREFEEIHPFFDGNGRVGHLIWAIAVTREGRSWPESLPPDIFGKESGKSTYISSFGEVEE